MLDIQKKQINLHDDGLNPLDCAEEIMTNNDWLYDRESDAEMSVTLSGEFGDYIMNFNWQEEYSALQFCCRLDMNISATYYKAAVRILNKINRNLWLGHFDLIEDESCVGTYIPRFRHTTLMREQNNIAVLPAIEDLVDVALHECERHFTAFSLLHDATPHSSQNMALALMDVAGRS